MDVSAAELLVNGRKLHFLAADAGRTLRLFSYEQQHPDTWRGKKLLPLCALPLHASCFSQYGISSAMCSERERDYIHLPTVVLQDGVPQYKPYLSCSTRLSCCSPVKMMGFATRQPG